MNNLKIMIVDDEPYILDLSSKLVEKMGYSEITTCESGQSALEICRDRKYCFDVIICDLNMPEMDGVEFLRHISVEDFCGGIILISGEDERILETARDLAKARNLNVLGYIAKPLKPDALKLLLSQYSPQDLKVSDSSLACISEEELREGMNGDELVIAFQPKTNLETGEVVAVEALARWNHSERGLLPPYTFIPFAEQNGLIDELTYSIYKKTLSQLKLWQGCNIHLKVSINISVNSFTKDGFIDFLTQTAKEYDIAHELIILEVTESQIMENTLDCLEVLMQLRMKNFGLSIDDFGTGHSSMTQVKSIPFTELKIDRSFVSGACLDSSARSILETSINLAKKLKMQTVAEGVETEEELALIKELGCDEAQGYFIARPMLANEFENFVQSYSKI